MADPRRFKGRSPLLGVLASYFGDVGVVPNVGEGEPLPDDFVGPPTAEQANAGKLNTQAPFKATNIFARPQVNQMNNQVMLQRMTADEQLQRQLSFVEQAEQMRQRLEAEGFPAEQARTISLQAAQAEQSRKDALLAESSLRPERLKTKAEEGRIESQTLLERERLLGEDRALNTYRNQLATNLVDPRSMQQYSDRVNPSALDAAELQARTKAVQGMTGLREAERINTQQPLLSNSISQTEQALAELGKNRALADLGNFPLENQNRVFDLRNFQRNQNEARARNMIVPTGDYSNIFTGGQVLTKPKSMQELMLERAMGLQTAPAGPSTAPQQQSYTSPTTSIKEETVRPASPTPFDSLHPARRLEASNAFFGELGTQVGFPRQHYGSSTVPESSNKFGDRFRNYVIQHPELDAQFQEVMPKEVETILAEILKRYATK